MPRGLICVVCCLVSGAVRVHDPRFRRNPPRNPGVESMRRCRRYRGGDAMWRRRRLGLDVPENTNEKWNGRVRPRGTPPRYGCLRRRRGSRPVGRAAHDPPRRGRAVRPAEPAARDPTRRRRTKHTARTARDPTRRRRTKHATRTTRDPTRRRRPGFCCARIRSRLDPRDHVRPAEWFRRGRRQSRVPDGGGRNDRFRRDRPDEKRDYRPRHYLPQRTPSGGCGHRGDVQGSRPAAHAADRRGHRS